MEDSSESSWQRTDSAGGLNSLAVSDRNLRLIRPSTVRYSDATSHDSGLALGRKRRDRAAHCIEAQVGFSGVVDDRVVVDPVVGAVQGNDISLRQWLDNPDRVVDALECLHIFKQIVDIVNLAHSQGIFVHNVRPSCFVMSSLNRISFIESASCSDSGSDSLEEGSNSQTADFKGLSSPLHRQGNHLGAMNQTHAFRRASETSGFQSISAHSIRESLQVSNFEQAGEKNHYFPMKRILLLETNWYTSPEEAGGAPSYCASDIYRLGVLLCELFCTFSSAEEKSAIMASLRHRVLPPQLLLKWPKEALFCLWLLHPEPNSRPKMGELLQSEFLSEPRENFEEREAAIELKEKIEEQELLLEFLLLMQQRRQEAADNLHETMSILSSDVEEVSKLQNVQKKKGSSNGQLGKDLPFVHPSVNLVDNDDSLSTGSRKRFRLGLQHRESDEYDDDYGEYQKSEPTDENQGGILSKSTRLLKNFRKLESAYFLTRCRAMRSAGKPSIRHSTISNDGRGSAVVSERSSVNNLPSEERYNEGTRSAWISSFLEGLCKYLSFSKLKVKANLKQGDLLNSSNLVCSLSFDRDGEFFATAGVNKKIKVFEYDSILSEDRDIHYPVVEMAGRSMLSSICWNGYIKSQIASSNFEGVVQVWDVTRSQVFMEMREHDRRVWSIDFSLSDPTMLASGSDDGSVKLWNINQGGSVGTIKSKANVCCVQFPFDSGRYLAFGSADHRIYYYDLRNSKMPLCTLIGHNKAVSYVKFIDSTNLVSASTDNTLKLWDLSMCTSRVLDSPLQSFTGHMNVKNFVGLSVSDGYIATGSETNEVFVYHKAFPMPVLSFKFNSTDPVSGDEVDDSAQFISSVCWHGQSSTLVAANSMGNVRLLEMV